ncbi:hypothetical protein HYX70_05190 [Candidatus Saccharibacteria bacterium]|nr:hypothetical protein [Candidatus Saccharibacteria bacterium]
MNAIQSCLELRKQASSIVADALSRAEGKSESRAAKGIISGLDKIKSASKGWYDPPPNGVVVLFGNPGEKYERTRFDSLRPEKYWPSPKYNFEKETVGLFHVSPFWQRTGIIADFGAAIYTGSDKKIHNHIVNGLGMVEDLAECSKVGMSFESRR